VLYHALTGSTPYQRDSDEATLWAHLNDPPPPVTSAVPGAPPEFEQVIARALAKDPDERYQSAGDLGRAALAAVGRSEALAPERIVATGPAAPDPRYGDETVVSPEHAPTVQQTSALDARRQRSRPRSEVLIGGAIAALLVAGGAAALLLGGGDDNPGTTATTTPRTTSTAALPPGIAGRVVGPGITAGFHPNAIVATSRYVWALSSSSSRVTLISSTTGKPSNRSPDVGAGATALTAGFGRVWVAKGNTGTVAPYGIADPIRKGNSFGVQGRPVSIAASAGSLWVGSRSPQDNPRDPGWVTKVDPTTGAQQPIPLSTGLQNLAVGAGKIWVIDGRRQGVIPYDIASGQPANPIATGDGAYAVAVGGGYVWVTNQTESTVSRINPTTHQTKKIRVGAGPKGLDVGGGAVWVANNVDNTVTRIDVKTGDVVGKPVQVGGGPFAVSVGAPNVWTTLLQQGVVARVIFR
jgi:hypothetical protein